MIEKFSKYQIATATAILFHAIGVVGILFSNNSFFANATPINLLLSLVLLIWTQKERNVFFWTFLIITITIGFTVEAIGVNTGKLFGNYTYGTVLGPKVLNVPLIIGINWFIIIYCCGVCLDMFLKNLLNKYRPNSTQGTGKLRVLSTIIDGATLAILLDILIEPVAIKLGMWKWGGDGTVPFFNYLSWFLISCLLLTIFQFCKFDKQNKFAVHLLLIQAMFFLILRTFMK
ncbi:carotenoid biosynthesis protein [Ferruginibacter sp. SUN002]|uniref:carotenoid biosynthesis protein n=1 Tax=Ferruginibacter sp. SUN002 TaxID=2937789 RepID=UPI003D36B7BB